MATVKVEVTAEDVAKGRQRNPYACPIACALERAGFLHPGVFPRKDITYVKDNKSVSIYLPIAAEDAVLKFDRVGTMEPFSFEVET